MLEKHARNRRCLLIYMLTMIVILKLLIHSNACYNTFQKPQRSQDFDPNSANSIQTATLDRSSLQSIVNVLKSLVDWEKLRRETKQNKDRQYVQEDVSSEDFKAKDSHGSANTFEKLKAEKSTIEAAISKVSDLGLSKIKRNTLVSSGVRHLGKYLEQMMQM